jgi:hypothetical protein
VSDLPRDIERRALLCGLLATLELAMAKRAFAGGSAPSRAADLVRRARKLCDSLRAGELRPEQWQAEIASLFEPIDPAELSQLIDVDGLLRGVARASRGATVVPVPWQAMIDAPARTGFAVKVFAFSAGRSNPPHAHDAMVSMHLVLRGRFHVRHFERVQTEPGQMVLRPSIDTELPPGGLTSISDARDNVHWHTALTEGVLLDVLQSGLGQRTTDTILLDVNAAERLEGGKLRAPVLPTVAEALAKYG